MKQSLSIKLGQQLKMTPQLQQAIRLLQLSALELEQEIQENIDANPLLESEEDWSDGGDGESGDSADSAVSGDDPNEPHELEASIDDAGAVGDMEFTDDYAAPELEPSDFPDNYGEEMISTEVVDVAIDGMGESEVSDQLHEPLAEDIPVDSNWDDVYPQSPAGNAAESDYDAGANDSAEETLESHLLWQLNLMPIADSDRQIALAIIDAINDDGLLGTSIQDICLTLAGNNQGSEPPPTEAEVTEILHRIQRFDPVGVGARDLRECLLLQLEQLDAATPWLNEATTLVSEHLDVLGNKDFTTLVRQTQLSEHELSQVVALIRTLQPRPGNALLVEKADYEIPDVLVRKDKGRWLVELNPETLPRVRINNTYAGLIKSIPTGPDKDYLRDNLQEAKWFLKSLQTRHDTLLKVAAKIVEVQKDFLEWGPEAMKPLILADIAQQVDLHESTISRVTNRKYLATPRGLFELKYFFSSHVGTTSGGEVSSTAIRALIRKVTAEENPRKPLSDSKIAAILAEQKINVARRTVAKYRESLSIPPSNERKQLV
ncbi:MAG TPA: RNA polymerase factor sigma-54 [Gammaproteobacteria bacterium]|nr:RNA polymerase factor sigma-54 [Gammaproteobacteria bacterium]HCG71414.1 RNA polymerase factor sigma-54 [Gammaproteobacteria bacterium]